MLSQLKLPRTQQAWALLYCRVMVLFALQGVVLMVLYAMRGFDAHPDTMPPGLKLDPLHSVIHLVTGLIGAYIGFWRPSAAVRFIQIFSVFYLLLAVLGTFTHFHFGMQLQLEENALHWPLGLLAALIGFAPQLLKARTPSA